MAKAEVRDAATVVAAREGAEGPEILVVRRSPGTRFLPGYVAFPGGALEPQDPALAERWFGSRAEAARACAVRELLEETGLALTGGGMLRTGARDGMAPIHAAPPRRTQLVQISHWATPEGFPIRFDVRFFAARAPTGVEPYAASPEVAEVRWARPADLLSSWAVGRVHLLWPTMKMIEALEACRSVDEILAARIPQQEPIGREGSGMPPSTFLEGP